MTRTGRCYCGVVQYRLEGDLGPLVNCHCQYCRRAHGAAFATVTLVQSADFRFTSSRQRRRRDSSTCASPRHEDRVRPCRFVPSSPRARGWCGRLRRGRLHFQDQELRCGPGGLQRIEHAHQVGAGSVSGNAHLCEPRAERRQLGALRRLDAQRVAGQPSPLRARLAWHSFCIRTVCQAWRRDDDMYWGKMGYALLSRGKLGAAIRWLADWPQRRDVQSWMLHNLVVALLNRFRDDAARAVLRHVARHSVEREDVNAQLKLWCAVGACLDDDLALADRLLHETPPDMAGEGLRALRDFGAVLVAVLRDAPRRASLTRERRAAIRLASRAYRRDNASMRLIKLAAYKIARHVRHPWMTLSWWIDVHPRAAALVFGIIAVIVIVMAGGR